MVSLSKLKLILEAITMEANGLPVPSRQEAWRRRTLDHRSNVRLRKRMAELDHRRKAAT